MLSVRSTSSHLHLVIQVFIYLWQLARVFTTQTGDTLRQAAVDDEPTVTGQTRPTAGIRAQTDARTECEVAWTGSHERRMAQRKTREDFEPAKTGARADERPRRY